jgi:NADH-quinone oxidoreductase subunit H
MMRRIAARLQRRVGPPFLQPLYDIVKLYGKRTQTSHGLVHDIGIVMAVGGYIAAETLLPVPGMSGIADKRAHHHGLLMNPVLGPRWGWASAPPSG